MNVATVKGILMQWFSFEPLSQQSELGKIIVPFLTINIVASLVFFLWPIAIPVYFAQVFLLAFWCSWGPGDFYQRLWACMALGFLALISQVYLWVVIVSVSSQVHLILVVALFLFSLFLLIQIPMWLLRYFWQWRISKTMDSGLGPFSMKHMFIGITLICTAFASLRWTGEILFEEFGPFRFEQAVLFSAVIVGELALMALIAIVTTIVVFKSEKMTYRIIPIVFLTGLASALSANIWFGSPERWFALIMIWLGGVTFCVAFAMPMSYLKSVGYQLFMGTPENMRQTPGA